ncbi:unnamed protein product, partial [Laminaria digitata]
KSDWWYKTQTIQTTYSSDGLGTKYENSEKYYYDNPAHKQLTKTERLESGKKLREVETRYPLDATNVAPNEMWNELNTNYKHVHNRPIFVNETIDGQLVKSIKSEYAYQNDQIVLEKRSSIDRNGHYQQEFAIELVNPKGQPRQIVGRDGVSTVLLWGYNYSKIVAEIK